VRNTIVRVVLLVSGGGVVVSGLLKGVSAPETAYGAGAFTAFLFGFLLLCAGGWTLSRGRRSRGDI
jgi:hypothetical protein